MEPGTIIIIYGPRRTGKTTLLKKLIDSEKDMAILYINAEDEEEGQLLDRGSLVKLIDILQNYSLLIIDEAQEIDQLGLKLKIIMDEVSELRVILSGSHSFDIAKDEQEALSGRKIFLKQYPSAEMEITKAEELEENGNSLEARLIYGAYPEVILTSNRFLREEYLREYGKSFLYRDIVKMENLIYKNKLEHLLTYLALRIGTEISIRDLARELEIKKDRVEHYLDLFEKLFFIYSLKGLKRNSPKEMATDRRYYFYDNGIRNAVIGNFAPLEKRNDIKQLWENYIIGERFKRQEYLSQKCPAYFWITSDKEEIDLVEEKDGKLEGYDMRWECINMEPPAEWVARYPGARFTVIHKGNYTKFIL